MRFVPCTYSIRFSLNNPAVNGDVEAGFGDFESQVVRIASNGVLIDEFNKQLEINS